MKFKQNTNINQNIENLSTDEIEKILDDLAEGKIMEELSENEIKSLLFGKWRCENTHDRWIVEFKEDYEYKMIMQVNRDLLERIYEQFTFFFIGDNITGAWLLEKNIIKTKVHNLPKSNIKNFFMASGLVGGLMIASTLNPLIGIGVAAGSVLGTTLKANEQMASPFEIFVQYLGNIKQTFKIAYINENMLVVKHNASKQMYVFQRIESDSKVKD